MASSWPSRVNKVNWSDLQSKDFFFKKVSYVIPSILLSLKIFVIQTSSHLPPISEGQENLPAESTVFASTL